MKKRILAGVLASTMMLSLAACGAETNGKKYKWVASCGLAVGSSWDLGLLRFGELLNERSDGAIELTVYSGATLGSPKECLEGVQMNSIQFMVESAASLSNFSDALNVFDLPYLFPDAHTAREVLGGETALAQLDKLEPALFKGINFWENGTYALGSVEPVETLADFKDMRVRSIDSSLQTDTYAALGAMPVVLSWGDIYTSLQQGVVDGVSSTSVTNMYTANFYEVAPNITFTNHAYAPAPMICSMDMWEELPEDIQQLVLECAEEARAYHYEVCDQQLEEYMTVMSDNGATFYEIDVEEWSAAVAPVYEKYVGTNGIDAAVVEAVQAEVAAVTE